MTRPTPGRIVLWHDEDGVTWPAIVLGVREGDELEELLDLEVFGPHQPPQRFRVDVRPASEGRTGWSWPPRV